MNINKLPACWLVTICLAFTYHDAAAEPGRLDCQIESKQSTRSVELIEEVERYFPNAAGLRICRVAGVATSASLVEEIRIRNDVATFRSVALSQYREALQGSGVLAPLTLLESIEPIADYICIEPYQCGTVEGSGFVSTSNLDEKYYPKVSKYWESISASIVDFGKSYPNSAPDLVDFLRSGGSLLPVHVTQGTARDGKPEVLVFVEEASKRQNRREWLLSLSLASTTAHLTNVVALEE
jgi:hypothetical protein